MHRSRLGNVVIDCQTDDLLSEAQFWSAALGYPLPQDLDAASDFIQLLTPAGLSFQQSVTKRERILILRQTQ